MNLTLPAILLFTATTLSQCSISRLNPFKEHTVGEALDSLNGVKVYYNGSVSNSTGRSVAPDGYNIGLKYQCVEFVKRYYYEYLHHKMPDSYGNAKDFFDASVKDGEQNTKRNLTQYTNGSKSKPKVSDLIILDATTFNKYGHVAIISEVEDDEIEIIQQNPGPGSRSRITFDLNHENNCWTVENKRVLGWLRKK